MNDQDDEANESVKKYEEMITKHTKKCQGRNLDHIYGHQKIIKNLTAQVILSFQNPEQFPLLINGVLLYGPPGTGKTKLAMGLVGQCGKHTKFLNVSTSDFESKFIGESEKNICAMFKAIKKNAPIIVFIDEAESLFGKREANIDNNALKVKGEFLRQWQPDEMRNVVILAATNLPWNFDEAHLRRFKKKYFIPLPSTQARFNIFKYEAQQQLSNSTDDDFWQMANQTHGYTGAEISTIVSNAAGIMREEYLDECELRNEMKQENNISIDVDFRNINSKDVFISINNSKASTKNTVLKLFQDFTNIYGHNTTSGFNINEEDRYKPKERTILEHIMGYFCIIGTENLNKNKNKRDYYKPQEDYSA